MGGGYKNFRPDFGIFEQNWHGEVTSIFYKKFVLGSILGGGGGGGQKNFSDAIASPLSNG